MLAVLVSLAIFPGLGAAAAGRKDPSKEPTYKEATVVVPIRTEGSTLDAETAPVEFRSVRMRIKESSGDRRRLRLIFHVVNTSREDYSARVDAALVDEAGETLATGSGESDVDPGEPETFDFEILVPREVLERAVSCRLKLAAWRN